MLSPFYHFISNSDVKNISQVKRVAQQLKQNKQICLAGNYPAEVYNGIVFSWLSDKPEIYFQCIPQPFSALLVLPLGIISISEVIKRLESVSIVNDLGGDIEFTVTENQEGDLFVELDIPEGSGSIHFQFKTFFKEESGERLLTLPLTALLMFERNEYNKMTQQELHFCIRTGLVSNGIVAHIEQGYQLDNAADYFIKNGLGAK
ncbi:hypothetical protein [Shewanella metallivivens]|uniref:Uncharacterized protein n=1 Tax=Shewanella metallivivens TaxID=2872342 RepID=A0ABT5TL45_9GAMM|nr:hypothetical protein [Shewanella metallivivens]MDD8059333.1 hypothetical protein [Shewanella metallivivens]